MHRYESNWYFFCPFLFTFWNLHYAYFVMLDGIPQVFKVFFILFHSFFLFLRVDFSIMWSSCWLILSFARSNLLLSPYSECMGEGTGTPLQYSCLDNPMDRGAWWAAAHGVAEIRTWLSDFTFTFHFHALEKEMTAHSSILARKIPGTGEPAPAIYGVAQSWTQLQRLSSSSSECISVFILFNSRISLF